MVKPPFYKRILSYLYPVRLAKASTQQNNVLELYLHRNQYQLATEDALYSDGTAYRPLNIAFKHLSNSLENVNTVLLLGTGLGSGIQILTLMGYYPAYTLVDYDRQILDWASDLFIKDTKLNIETICADANDFVQQDESVYDMIIVDVFDGRVVPAFVVSEEFIRKCRRKLNSGGIFILNYIVNDKAEWQQALQQINLYFNNYKLIENGINNIVIAIV